MRHLESAGHRGHGTERTLEATMGTGACSGTHEPRVRQLSDGTMTGGNQPTNIRGINRRGKVPGGPLAPGAFFVDRRAGPYSETPRSIDGSIHISCHIACRFSRSMQHFVRTPLCSENVFESED